MYLEITIIQVKHWTLSKNPCFVFSLSMQEAGHMFSMVWMIKRGTMQNCEILSKFQTQLIPLPQQSAWFAVTLVRKTDINWDVQKGKQFHCVLLSNLLYFKDIQMIISIPGVHYTSSLNVHFLYCLQIHLLYTIQKDNCKKYVTLTMVSTWKSANTTESALYS